MNNSVEKARAKLERQQVELEVTEHIANGLPSAVPEPKHIFCVKLWGAVATVSWKLTNAEDVLTILDNLPPIESRYLVEQGCVSMRPKSAVPNLDQGKPVDPITVDIKHGDRGYPLHMSGITVNWFTTIGGEPVQVKVEFVDACVNDNWPQVQTEEVGVGKNKRLKTHLAPGALMGTNGRTIRWASGGPMTPNQFSVYWPCEAPTLDFDQARNFLTMLL
jgi:hypothetical protein